MLQYNKYQTEGRPHSSLKIYLHSLRLFCTAFIAIALAAYAPDCMAQKTEVNFTPQVRGQIFNVEDGTPVAFAVITNHRTKESVSADLNGIFVVNASITDSLEISSLGFHKEIVAIPSIYNVSEIMTLYARPLSFLIPDINVTVTKEQMKIDKENRIASPYFRNDIMKDKPASEKVYDNQISLFKIPLGGKKDKSRQKVQAAEENDRQWASISRVYNKDLVIALTNLNNTEADNFMIYLNGKNLFKRMTTKQNATYTILQQFKIYKEEGH